MTHLTILFCGQTAFKHAVDNVNKSFVNLFLVFRSLALIVVHTESCVFVDALGCIQCKFDDSESRQMYKINNGRIVYKTLKTAKTNTTH